jgi:hypothetical protein
LAGPRGASSALPSTQTAASERAPERAEHHDHEGLTRPRHHRAALLGCAGPRWRRSLTDGRWSGGFTAEATGAARQATRVSALYLARIASGGCWPSWRCSGL